MAVAFDVLGTASVLSGGSTGVVTTSFTAPAGDDVLWVICTSQIDTITAVTCGGTSMTLVQSQGTDPGFLGLVNVYRLAGGATGSAQTLSANIGYYIGCRQLPFSLSGVSSAAPSSASTYGQSSAGVAVTSGAITCTTGQLIVSIFGSAYSGYMSTIGSPTGGTAQFYAPTSTADGENLAVITSSSSTTTGVTFSATQYYANINLVFSPASGATVTPSTATIAATGGTPSENQSVPPASGTVAVTGGTPAESLQSGLVPTSTATVVVAGGVPSEGLAVRPGAGTIALSGGTPVENQIPATPLGNVLAKLAAHQSVVLQFIGDSTVAGYGDGGNTNGPGWATRMAIGLGQLYNATVQLKVYGGIPGATGYGGSWTTEYTGTSGAVISVYNGGVDGTTLTDQQSYYLPGDPNTVIGATPDCIFIGDAYNDLSGSEAPATFLSAYQQFITSLQAVCPNIPIVVGTENPFSGNDSTIVAGLDAVTTWLVAQNLPLSPALQSTVVPLVWVLDTRQAYGNIWQTALYYNAQHPNAAGYTQQAQWMLGELAGLAYPPGAAVAATGGTSSEDQRVKPSGATVAATGGAPSESQDSALLPASADVAFTGVAPPLGVAINPSGAAMTATGGAASLDQNVVPPSGAAITATGGTSSESQRSGLTPLPAQVSVTGGTPLLDQGILPSGATVAAADGTSSLDQGVAPGGADITVAGDMPAIALVAPQLIDVRQTTLIPRESRTVLIARESRTVLVQGGKT
jgi:lysophospholipase L1-like esterase